MNLLSTKFLLENYFLFLKCFHKPDCKVLSRKHLSEIYKQSGVVKAVMSLISSPDSSSVAGITSYIYIIECKS